MSKGVECVGEVAEAGIPGFVFGGDAAWLLLETLQKPRDRHAVSPKFSTKIVKDSRGTTRVVRILQACFQLIVCLLDLIELDRTEGTVTNARYLTYISIYLPDGFLKRPEGWRDEFFQFSQGRLPSRR